MIDRLTLCWFTLVNNRVIEAKNVLAVVRKRIETMEIITKNLDLC